MLQKSISIPIPEVVSAALMPIPDDPCVSHRVQKVRRSGDASRKPDPELTPLSTNNHGFYLGRILRGKSSNDERGPYSTELILAALDYLFSHVQPGEKPTLVLCQILSELCNGEDTRPALSTSEQRQLIYGLARKHFKKTSEELHIVEPGEQPEHAALFKAFHETADASPRCAADFGKVLKAAPGLNLAPSKPTSSYAVAGALYNGMMEHEGLRAAFQHAIPERLYSGVTDWETSPLPYYALLEISVRLTDILHGRFIHGGIERQDIYDDIIRRLLEGKTGGFRGARALSPLFTRLEDCPRFETLHLSTQKNPYELTAQRSLARRALGRWAAAFLAGATAIYGIGYERGRKADDTSQTNLEKFLGDQLAGTTFYFEGKWPLKDMTQHDKAKAFLRIQDDMLSEILLMRYPSLKKINDQVSLEALFQTFLLKNGKQGLGTVRDSRMNWVALLDKFVQGHRNVFLARGVSAAELEPYAHFAPEDEAFKRTENLERDFEFLDEATLNAVGGFGPITSSGVSTRLIRRLGMFQGSESWDYVRDELYLAEYAGEIYVVAYDRMKSQNRRSRSFNPDAKVYSTAPAKEVIAKFRKAVQIYEMLPFLWENYKFPHAALPDGVADFEIDDGMKSLAQAQGSIQSYRSATDGFDYEILETYWWDDTQNVRHPVFAARDVLRGDAIFSTATAREVFDRMALVDIGGYHSMK